ncbi:MAG TPA: hypothetical protein VKU85_14625 [bacterium]|nr:hypothetical protein [bacterium]
MSARNRHPLVLLAALLAVASHAHAAGTPYHDLAPERNAIALTPGLENEDLAAVLDRLEARGVTVPVAVSGAGLILVDSPGLDEALASQGIGPALREPVGATLRAAHSRAGGLLAWWNEGFRAPEPQPEPSLRVEAEICAGARALKDVLPATPFRCGPGDYGTVHFAAGRCIVNVILPEGPQSPWNGSDVTTVESENLRALNWWSLKSSRALSFVVINYGPVPTDEEPAQLSSAQEGLYIEDCLANLGYAPVCPYTQVAELNTDTRDRNGGHWAYAQFILNADFFPNGSFLAYAYLGGPVTVALRGNASLGPQYLDRVIAHEVGHIFQVADEYQGGCSCGGTYGYLDEPNLNCVTCPPPTERCIMRSASEYSLSEMDNMEQAIHPCEHTKKMAGIWDSDGDGIWDVRETYPSSLFTSTLPETLDASLNVRVTGTSWDVPFPAPARFGTPVTVNRIAKVEYRVDGSPPAQAMAADGLFTEESEDWILSLPELGGGPHLLSVTAFNTVFHGEQTPEQISFFVHDVKLREDLFADPENGAMAVTWRTDGEDFGSTYSLFRRVAGEASEALLGTVPSQGGRNDRFVFWDREVRAGREYVYRLEVDIPGKGRKELGLVRQEAGLANPPPGRIAAVAPNPSRGEILLSVSVPRGPKAGVDDVLIPGEGASGFRDDEPQTPGGVSAGTPWRDVRIVIYDVRGRIVRDLGTFRHQETTRFNAAWDGRYRDGSPAPAGVYFARIGLDYTHSIEKLVLIR